MLPCFQFSKKSQKVPRLRVLHIFDEYLPNTENWAYNLINNLPEVDNYIGANRYLDNSFFNPQFHFLKINPFKQKIKLFLNWVFLKNPKARIKLNQISKNSFVSACSDNDISIVHCHFANVGYANINLLRSHNIPYIVSFYGWDYEKLPNTNPQYKKHYQELFQKASLIICEGLYGAQTLIKIGCPKEKVCVSSLGVKIELFEPKTKKSQSLKLVQIASYTEKKGHIYSIQALARIINKHPNITLDFIGNNNDYTDQLKRLTTELNIAHKVKFLDPINPNKLSETLQKYDVFIHPSCHAYDLDCEGGAPIVLLDAQLCGLPVISTYHCDIPSEVINEKTGLLSPEKDVEAIARNIEKFYHLDSKKYTEYSSRAIKHVINHFDISKNAKNLQSIYSELYLTHKSKIDK